MGNREQFMLEFKEVSTLGKLITFCGLDGSGKTTMINRLQEYLNIQGISTMITKQPTEIVRKSEIFRSFIDKPSQEQFDYMALTLFAAADRVQHSNHVILPALKKGYTVLSDRYFYSCLANFRVMGFGKENWIYKIVKYISKPDIAFFLDTEVDTAISRVRNRRNERDRYIDINFQKKLREEYLNLAKENNGIVIPASCGIEEAFEIIKERVNRI